MRQTHLHSVTSKRAVLFAIGKHVDNHGTYNYSTEDDLNLYILLDRAKHLSSAFCRSLIRKIAIPFLHRSISQLLPSDHAKALRERLVAIIVGEALKIAEKSSHHVNTINQ